jgi:hypothetical protein
MAINCNFTFTEEYVVINDNNSATNATADDRNESVSIQFIPFECDEMEMPDDKKQ